MSAEVYDVNNYNGFQNTQKSPPIFVYAMRFLQIFTLPLFTHHQNTFFYKLLFLIKCKYKSASNRGKIRGRASHNEPLARNCVAI